MEADGIERDTPTGNKADKTRLWLRCANESKPDPIATLGKVITELMEVDISRNTGFIPQEDLEREKVNKALSEHGLSYKKGGYILSAGTTEASNTLQHLIQARDLSGLQTEVDRIYQNVESDPPSAVTASFALLQALFKTYI